MPKNRKRTITQLCGSAAIKFCLFYVSYVLLVSTLDSTELIAGLAAALVATVAVSIGSKRNKLEACPAMKDVAECSRIPWHVLKGAARMLGVLCLHVLRIRPAGSVLRAVHYTDDPNACRATARRALASLFTTMTPNSIVLGFTRDRQFLLVHQIEVEELPPMARHLGARS